MKNQKEFFVVVVVIAVAKQPKYQQLIKAKFVPNSAKVMKKNAFFFMQPIPLQNFTFYVRRCLS